MRVSLKWSAIVLAAMSCGVDASAALFSADNLVVVLAGDGQSVAGSANSAAVLPVVLQELTASGAVVQSVALPTATNGSQYPLTLGRDRAIGQLNLTADGRHLVIGGTGLAPRTTAVGAVPRTVGRVSFDGSVDTSTRIVGSYDDLTESGIRGVASADGSAFWLAGKGTGDRGIQYIEIGQSTPTLLTDPLLNSRHLSIVDGQLYNTDKQVDAVGAGLPTVGTVVPTPFIPNAAGGGDWNSAQLFDLDDSIPGVDTVYFAYASHETGNHIEKWAFNGASWLQNEVFNIVLPSEVQPAAGVLFLTARELGDDIELLATTRGLANNSTENSLVRILDHSAGSTTTYLATAPQHYTFKGVAFAPIPEPMAASLLAFCLAPALMPPRR